MSNDTQAQNEHNLPIVQRIISVLWPSFLVASLATVLFFVVFDPQELGMLAGLPELTRTGGYTIGFFFFWILGAMGCALTCYFRKPCPPRIPTDQTD
jgi:hypothetical protein